ncbi:hypothetical protein FGO68_gene3027 [Halteria grandinella]|uniref:Uncharacterized protein n=1 Tax=Halteria grandinella TaxID=5974 RepID=A0A8J8T534_HALGN|nr:hypothetical protein FGO68_gene3027 [Halteria grandinella]
MSRHSDNFCDDFQPRETYLVKAWGRRGCSEKWQAQNIIKPISLPIYIINNSLITWSHFLQQQSKSPYQRINLPKMRKRSKRRQHRPLQSCSRQSRSQKSKTLQYQGLKRRKVRHVSFSPISAMVMKTIRDCYKTISWARWVSHQRKSQQYPA